MDTPDPQRVQELFEYIKENELFDGFSIVTPTRPVKLTQTEFEGYTTAEVIGACQLLNQWLCSIWGFVTGRGEDYVSGARVMTQWERERRYRDANPKRFNIMRNGQKKRRKERQRKKEEEKLNEHLKKLGVEF